MSYLRPSQSVEMSLPCASLFILQRDSQCFLFFLVGFFFLVIVSICFPYDQRLQIFTFINLFPHCLLSSSIFFINLVKGSDIFFPFLHLLTAFSLDFYISSITWITSWNDEGQKKKSRLVLFHRIFQFTNSFHSHYV